MRETLPERFRRFPLSTFICLTPIINYEFFSFLYKKIQLRISFENKEIFTCSCSL